MVKGSRYVYLVAAWLFLLGVIVQVYFAGMAVVAMQIAWWGSHIGLGHTLAGPLLIMLVSMYLGKMPSRVKNVTWLLFLVYVIQSDVVIFLRVQAPIVSALHPVLALFDFALASVLAYWALPLTKSVPIKAAMQTEV
jgi:hypothetical protein